MNDYLSSLGGKKDLKNIMAYNESEWELELSTRGLHGSKNSYPNPKRPVNMLHGTDPDPYFI